MYLSPQTLSHVLRDYKLPDDEGGLNEFRMRIIAHARITDNTSITSPWVTEGRKQRPRTYLTYEGEEELEQPTQTYPAYSQMYPAFPSWEIHNNKLFLRGTTIHKQAVGRLIQQKSMLRTIHVASPVKRQT